MRIYFEPISSFFEKSWKRNSTRAWKTKNYRRENRTNNSFIRTHGRSYQWILLSLDERETSHFDLTTRSNLIRSTLTQTLNLWHWYTPPVWIVISQPIDLITNDHEYLRCNKCFTWHSRFHLQWQMKCKSLVIFNTPLLLFLPSDK